MKTIGRGKQERGDSSEGRKEEMVRMVRKGGKEKRRGGRRGEGREEKQGKVEEERRGRR